MNFKKLTLADIEFVRPYFEKYYDGSCDRTVGGTFIWRDYYNTEMAVYKNTLIFRENLNGSFCFPVGDEAEEAIKELGRVKFSFVSKENKDVILSVYPDSLVTSERDYFDYIYDAKSMIELKGKSLSGQRNHINKFLRLYPEHSFEIITEDNLGRVSEFFERYSAEAVKNASSAVEDREKTFEVLENYKEYGMLGGFLTVDGEIIGASIGEIVGDTLIVHIEKAFTSFKGAYPMLTNLFNKQFAYDLKFINREDDAGDEGLRKNKLSYQPIRLFEKYNVNTSEKGETK